MGGSVDFCIWPASMQFWRHDDGSTSKVTDVDRDEVVRDIAEAFLEWGMTIDAGEGFINTKKWKRKFLGLVFRRDDVSITTRGFGRAPVVVYRKSGCVAEINGEIIAGNVLFLTPQLTREWKLDDGSQQVMTPGDRRTMVRDIESLYAQLRAKLDLNGFWETQGN